MSLHIGLKKSGGRNNLGRITIRHRGGGHKRLYRKLEYNLNDYQYNISGTIKRIEYDPNRTAYLAECVNNNRTFYKILGSHQKHQKDIVVKKLKEVGIGEEVYNISIRVGQQAKICRASGAKGKILKQGEKDTVIRLPSQQIKVLNNNNSCNLGSVVSKDQNKIIGKAGRSRWMGIRPSVRGVAMNPIDHPNGGKTAGGGQPKTPWGKLAKWVPTRKKKRKG